MMPCRHSIMQPPLREAEAGALTPAPARPRCRSGWSLERLLPARNGGARNSARARALPGRFSSCAPSRRRVLRFLPCIPNDSYAVVALIVLAALTACEPPAIPSAEDLPDEPEAPPNTTDPLGNPIDPEPPSPPETPPTGNPAGPAPKRHALEPLSRNRSPAEREPTGAAGGAPAARVVLRPPRGPRTR